MNSLSTLFKGLCCLLLTSGVASADLAINFVAPNRRGGDTVDPLPTVSDFIAITG